MRFTLGVLLVAGCTGVAAAEEANLAGEGWYCNQPKAVYDHQISKDDVRINNFNILERDDFLNQSQRIITFSYAVANRGTKDVDLDAQVAGFDKDNKLIFAIRAAPLMNRVNAGATSEAKGDVFAQRDDLKKVNSICLKISGNF